MYSLSRLFSYAGLKIKVQSLMTDIYIHILKSITFLGIKKHNINSPSCQVQLQFTWYIGMQQPRYIFSSTRYPSLLSIKRLNRMRNFSNGSKDLCWESNPRPFDLESIQCSIPQTSWCIPLSSLPLTVHASFSLSLSHDGRPHMDEYQEINSNWSLSYSFIHLFISRFLGSCNEYVKFVVNNVPVVSPRIPRIAYLRSTMHSFSVRQRLYRRYDHNNIKWQGTKTPCPTVPCVNIFTSIQYSVGVNDITGTFAYHSITFYCFVQVQFSQKHNTVHVRPDRGSNP